MDGYAVRATDITTLPARLTVTGSIAAGAEPTQSLKPGDAVRIFTGAFLPDGADSVVIQENCDRDNDIVTVREGSNSRGQHVRLKGNDFRAGEIGIERGRQLTARDVALAAAMNWPFLPVTRKPRIAILSTGDELQHPGEVLGPAQIVASNGFGLAALVTACGGEPNYLGIARDNLGDLDRMIAAANGADLLVTTGGASVGEHDLIQKALAARGAKLDFWKIAMRPGKPVMFGALGAMPVLGLPGNPVSALITASLFLKPAIEKMLGRVGGAIVSATAKLGAPMKANDQRQDYLRATLARDSEGALVAKADALIVRAPHAPEAKVGDLTEIVSLSGGSVGL
jgi:molybdopterin molybdotransferase